jgi:hypothetical protein
MEINLQVEQVVSLNRRQSDCSSIINYFIFGTSEQHPPSLHKSDCLTSWHRIVPEQLQVIQSVRELHALMEP